MKKLDQIKAKLKKHAPEIIIGAVTVAGTVGWIIAGVYAGKVRDLETVDENAWPMIEITPGNMKDIREGATLLYREFKTGPTSWVAQSSTHDNGFPPEADEEYNRRIQN